MSSVYVIRRPLKLRQGEKQRYRYHVRWQYDQHLPAVHLGSFPTRKAAEIRRFAAYEELARGERPRKYVVTPAPVETTIETLAEAWLETRVDVAQATMRHYVVSLTHIRKAFGTRDPKSVTVDEVQAWVSGMQGKPGTIGLRLSTLGQLLDYARVEPNPVADKHLRKPKQKKRRHRMPTIRELDALYAALPAKYRPIVHALEDTGARISDLIGITWADWNDTRKVLTIREAKTDAGERLIVQVDGRPDLGKRPKGVALTTRVFSSITGGGVGNAMARACIKAGIPRYSPHDLRHLSASRLLHDGKLSPGQIADRLGHSSPQITLTTYAKSLPPEEE